MKTKNGRPEAAKRVLPIDDPIELALPGAQALTVFDIIGVSPILMNNPASMGQSDGQMKVGNKFATGEEEAQAKVYAMPDGQLCIPSIAFRGALIKAGSGRKIGKYFVTTLVSGAIFTVETECRLVRAGTADPICAYKIDTRRVTLPNGSSISRSRPLVENWGTSLALEIDPQFFPDVRLVEELMNIAGKIVGVMDFRPECKGPFGRFRAVMRK